MGRRTVSHILWSVRPLMEGHYSSYHRVFSAARWSTWVLARILATAVVAQVPADQPVVLSVDDTLAGHRGRRVLWQGMPSRRRPLVRAANRFQVGTSMGGHGGERHAAFVQTSLGIAGVAGVV